MSLCAYQQYRVMFFTGLGQRTSTAKMFLGLSKDLKSVRPIYLRDLCRKARQFDHTQANSEKEG